MLSRPVHPVARSVAIVPIIGIASQLMIGKISTGSKSAPLEPRFSAALARPRRRPLRPLATQLTT